MTRQAPFLIAWLALAAGMLGLAAAAHADTVTRTLQQSINVPAGDSIVVENLVGHMTVTQGNGPLQVTATVVAGGDQAQALAQSIKLDVSTHDNQVLVHVDYPVDRYDTFLYNPSNLQANNSNQACILANLICFRGNSNSGVRYQGSRVRVQTNERDSSGAPLYVNLAVQIPKHVNAGFSNAVGLLEADGLVNELSLTSQGGDIRVRNLQGQLEVQSRGGDVYASGITSQDVTVHTDGGDLTGSKLNGNLSLATGGGDVGLDTLGGHLAIRSGGGDIRLSGKLAGLLTLVAHSGGGDLTVAGNLAALTSLDAESGGGDIVLKVNNLDLRLEAASGGGDIDVNLPDLRDVSSSSDHFSAYIGKAAGTATLASGGGDITVTQP